MKSSILKIKLETHLLPSSYWYISKDLNAIPQSKKDYLPKSIKIVYLKVPAKVREKEPKHFPADIDKQEDIYS